MISSTTRNLLGRDEVDEKALSGLRGVVKISHTTVNGISLLNFDGFAPASQWEELSSASCFKNTGIRGGLMTYSYTQISQYLSCPRRYRHRYLDGWKEKDTRAAMLFGRAFEQALSAYFRREDPGAVLFREWAAHKDSELEYSNGTTWDRMLQQGIQLLERFAQDDRIRIRRPRKNLQIKFTQLCRTAMTSSPTLTPSDSWMAPVACWSGRPLPAGIRKNRTDC